jgi:hypothetical protein
MTKDREERELVNRSTKDLPDQWLVPDSEISRHSTDLTVSSSLGTASASPRSTLGAIVSAPLPPRSSLGVFVMTVQKVSLSDHSSDSSVQLRLRRRPHWDVVACWSVAAQVVSA